MAKCPICSGPVPDDFGLIECAKCGAPLLVHMDGRVAHSGAQVDEAVEIPPESALENDDGTVVSDEQFEFTGGQGEIELDSAGDSAEPTLMNESEGFGEAEGQSIEEDGEAVPMEPPVAEPEGHDKSFHFADQQDSPSPATPTYSSESPVTTDPSSPDLSDIARFGNSDATSHDGSLRYRVFVTGIDTADVRDSFREAITDRKMMWDIEEILRSIKNGEVEMQNISPVKAYILVSRLRSLPVQVRWEQYAIAQS